MSVRKVVCIGIEITFHIIQLVMFFTLLGYRIIKVIIMMIIIIIIIIVIIIIIIIIII